MASHSLRRAPSFIRCSKPHAVWSTVPRKQPHLTQVPLTSWCCNISLPLPIRFQGNQRTPFLPNLYSLAQPGHAILYLVMLLPFSPWHLDLHDINNLLVYLLFASLECKFTEHRDFALFTVLFSEPRFTVRIQIIFIDWMNKYEYCHIRL